MSLFFPFYNQNGRPNTSQHDQSKDQHSSDPLTTFFRDLNRTADLLNKAATRDTLYSLLKDIDNTRFDNLVSSDENATTYIVNVPEEINQNDVSIDVTNDNRTLIVEIEKTHDNGASESYRHIRTTPRRIDVENLKAHLDAEKSQIVVEIPFEVQKEDALPSSEDEGLVPLAINVRENAVDEVQDPGGQNTGVSEKDTAGDVENRDS